MRSAHLLNLIHYSFNFSPLTTAINSLRRGKNGTAAPRSSPRLSDYHKLGSDEHERSFRVGICILGKEKRKARPVPSPTHLTDVCCRGNRVASAALLDTPARRGVALVTGRHKFATARISMTHSIHNSFDLDIILGISALPPMPLATHPV